MLPQKVSAFSLSVTFDPRFHNTGEQPQPGSTKAKNQIV
jgi:hypothetical protein